MHPCSISTLVTCYSKVRQMMSLIRRVLFLFDCSCLGCGKDCCQSTLRLDRRIIKVQTLSFLRKRAAMLQVLSDV